MATSAANGAARARQLLLEVFSPFVQDQAALKSLASSAASAKLSAFAADLVNAAGKTSSALGADQKSQSETTAWLSKIEDGSTTSDLKTLEAMLETRTYLAGPAATAPSAADYALFAALFGQVSALPAAEQHAIPSVTRFISHLSQAPHVITAGSKLDPAITPFEPVFEGMPRVPGRAPPEKPKKEKAPAAAAAAAAGEESSKAAKAKGSKKAEAADAAAGGAAVAAPEEAPAEGKKDKKKDKKDKKEAAVDGAKPAKAKGSAGGGGGGAAAPAATGPLPSMVDLRVGKIVAIEKHPDADSLYLETVDFGEPEGPRQVLSGLVNYVPIEQMRDRWVVGICNLKPQAMRGIKSHAMLLCATHKDGKEGGVEPILPPEGSKPGDRIWVEGYEGMDPETQLNPKKKIFEAIQPGYCTNADKEAGWVGPGPSDGPDGPKVTRLLRTEKGVCKAPTFVEATLS